MDRCALFVDAGYLLADGAMAVHGTRNRDSVSWDYAGLVRLLDEMARDRTGLSVLRCYWYEATVDDGRTQEQDGIADIPGVKFRAARIRPGRREGVESHVQRDLTTLARTGVLCEAVVVGGDEDMAPAISEVQDLGVRVTVVPVSVEGHWTISRALRHECDDLIELGAGHLRPYVSLIAATGGGEENAAFGHGQPVSNGQPRSNPAQANHQPVAAQTGGARGVDPNAPGMDPMYASTGAQGPHSGNAMEQLRAMQQSLAQQRGGGDHLAPEGTSPAMEPPQQRPSRGIRQGRWTSPDSPQAATPRRPPHPPRRIRALR